MKNKTAWAIVGVLAIFALLIAVNALITWALTKFAILPIAVAMGYELPFWPVFVLTWVVAGFVTSLAQKKGVASSTHSN